MLKSITLNNKFDRKTITSLLKRKISIKFDFRAKTFEVLTDVILFLCDFLIQIFFANNVTNCMNQQTLVAFLRSFCKMSLLLSTNYLISFFFINYPYFQVFHLLSPILTRFLTIITPFTLFFLFLFDLLLYQAYSFLYCLFRLLPLLSV